MHFTWKITTVSFLLVFQAILRPSHCQSGDGPVGFGSVITDVEDDTYIITGSIPSDFVTEKNEDLDDWYLTDDAEEESESKTGHKNVTIIIDYESIIRTTDEKRTTKNTNEFISATKGATTRSSSSSSSSSGGVKDALSSTDSAFGTGTGTGTVTEAEATTDVDESTERARVQSSKGTIILVLLATVVLIGTCCVWRFIRLRAKRAASNRRRHLEHQSLTNGLLTDSEKNPYRELSVVRGDGDEDLDLNQREKFNLPKPVISNNVMNSFTATVTVEGDENGDLGVTGNPRFSPPPTYEAFLKASREQLDREIEEQAYFLPNMSNTGPSYR